MWMFEVGHPNMAEKIVFKMVGKDLGRYGQNRPRNYKYENSLGEP